MTIKPLPTIPELLIRTLRGLAKAHRQPRRNAKRLVNRRQVLKYADYVRSCGVEEASVQSAIEGV